VPYFNAAKLSI